MAGRSLFGQTVLIFTMFSISMARMHVRDVLHSVRLPVLGRLRTRCSRQVHMKQFSMIMGGGTGELIPDPQQLTEQKMWFGTQTHTADKKPRVIFVLGGPGSGKGTQCEIMTKNFPFVHLSAGDLLRRERDRNGSKYGDLIQKHITEGKIVPVEITVNLLKDEMERQLETSDWFLIDGFPRSYENLRGWDSVINKWADVVGVLFLDCPEAEMEKRILERAKTEGRSDDNMSTIKKRFHTYEEDTMPVIEHYKRENKLFTISAADDRDTVSRNVDALMRHLTDFDQ